MIQVQSLEHLKSLASNEQDDCVSFFTSLAGGSAKGSNRILYVSELDEFMIIHEIDKSSQEFKSSDIAKETNLIEAIQNGCLFQGA